MDKFWAKVERGSADECWKWVGAIAGRTGYGHFLFEGRQMGAHRASWCLHHGPIPEGMWVLHRCDVRSCVNPDHLFLGTAKDNNADMVAKGRQRHVSWNAAKTHCDRGHEFTPDNTYIFPSGHRRCVTCHRESAARYRRDNAEKLRQQRVAWDARYYEKLQRSLVSSAV